MGQSSQKGRYFHSESAAPNRELQMKGVVASGTALGHGTGGASHASGASTQLGFLGQAQQQPSYLAACTVRNLLAALPAQGSPLG